MPPFNRASLLAMLAYARPHGSATEAAFIDRFIAPLPNAYRDDGRNWHVHIGGDVPILWSCHTDTVHGFAGWQTLHYDKAHARVALSKRAQLRQGACLGADDTAGVALCIHLILAGIPGHYVFHFGEEVGGIGSRWLAAHHPTWLKGFSCAIALDRRGTGDVITHQGSRCCSDAFADSLANALDLFGMTYTSCDSGVYTDTAEYTELIGECTNLSVGYEHAHSAQEYLDLDHMDRLAAALCAADYSTLAYTRVPGEVDPEDTRGLWSAQYRDYMLHDARDPDLLCACEYCGEYYEEATSTAHEQAHYCSLTCEGEDTHDSTYLRRVYADVQAALKREDK